MPKLIPSIWLDGTAQEAAEFYRSIFPNSRIDHVSTAAADFPSGRKGDVLTVDLTLEGRPFNLLNGGPEFKPDEAISFMVECSDQEEVDRYWNALVQDGGEHGPCGWLKDRYGVSWQVAPGRLQELLDSPDREGAQRAMEAMLQMGKIDIAEIEAAFNGTPARV
jgi:predicted 3-demethylubiquinone-9 3-methyltransferase (glyoxalase superfamily)